MSSGYHEVDVVETGLLLPHEETLENLTREISERIRKDGFVIHPVIADRESLVIVDGMHRAAALRLLQIPLTPVYLVDYMSSKVSLNCWYRVTERRIPEETIERLAHLHGFGVRRVEFEEALEGVERRRYVMGFLSRGAGKVLVLEAEGGWGMDILEIYSRIRTIDREMRVYGVSYVRENDGLRMVKNMEAGSCCMVPRVRKDEVIRLARRGKLLPPKTTRHVVDERPMFVFTPLELLEGGDAERARATQREMLRGRRYVTLPPNQVIDRVYEERVRVYIHEDEKFLRYYPQHLLEKITGGDASP